MTPPPPVSTSCAPWKPVSPARPFPHVRPGAEILLRVSDAPKVERVLQAMDAIEALGIAPCMVSPEHWRHVHNRIAAREPFRTYTKAQHAAWLKRRVGHACRSQ